MALLAMSADRLGVSLHGVVGGLAIALAARPRVENLVGGMNLFADKPIPIGDVYVGRDRGPNDTKSQAAEAVVRKWREKGALPFPNFSPEQASRVRGAIS